MNWKGEDGEKLEKHEFEMKERRETLTIFSILPLSLTARLSHHAKRSSE
jgi:hypothetical protein